MKSGVNCWDIQPSSIPPVEISKCNDAQEFARIVEINMSDVEILWDGQLDNSMEFVYRDEYAGNDPEFWWVRFERKNNND